MRYLIILILLSYTLSHNSVVQSQSNCGENPFDEFFDLSDAEQLEIGLDHLESKEVSDRWVEHTRCLADSGDPDAQLSMGVLYRDGGDGVPQNYSRAAEWFLKAARNGNGMAMYNLGMIYLDGLGAQPNLAEAHVWFNLAAANLERNDIGARRRAFTYRNEIGGQLSPEEINSAQEKALQIKNEIDAR